MGRTFRHPLFVLLGLRKVIAEHTPGEDEMLRRYAHGRRTIVELGVSEGGSAFAFRTAMPSDATLWLVDPYFAGRIPGLNVSMLVAKRHVNSVRQGKVRWIRELSWDAAAHWSGPPIDLLFIDADHSFAAAKKDWEAWSPLIATGGVILLHDARRFEGGLAVVTGASQLVDGMFRADGPKDWIIVEELDSSVVLHRRHLPRD